MCNAVTLCLIHLHSNNVLDYIYQIAYNLCNAVTLFLIQFHSNNVLHTLTCLWHIMYDVVFLYLFYNYTALRMSVYCKLLWCFDLQQPGVTYVRWSWEHGRHCLAACSMSFHGLDHCFLRPHQGHFLSGKGQIIILLSYSTYYNQINNLRWLIYHYKFFSKSHVLLPTYYYDLKKNKMTFLSRDNYGMFTILSATAHPNKILVYNCQLI